MRRLFSNPNAFRRTVLAGDRLHLYKPDSAMSGDELAAIEARREGAQLIAAKEDRKSQRHMRAVKNAMVLMRKRKDKRRRPSRVSKKAFKTIRKLKLK